MSGSDVEVNCVSEARAKNMRENKKEEKKCEQKRGALVASNTTLVVVLDDDLKVLWHHLFCAYSLPSQV